MSAPLEKIRKQAAQYEHDRQYDRALACYARLLDATADGDDTDIALFNRAGDVAVRAGQVEQAVQYFERALDRYAAGGLLNNAIAVGVKVLRHAPTHVAAHYTLGVLYAKKGFRSDARHHLLAYALRMQRGGNEAEVTRALADFTALADDADAARAELSHHLAGIGPRDADAGTALTRTLERTLASLALADATPPRGGLDAADGGVAANLVFLDVGLGDRAASAPALTPGFEPTTFEDGGSPPAPPAPSSAGSVALEPLAFAAVLPGEPAPMTVAWLDHAPSDDAPAPEAAPTFDFLPAEPGVALLDVPSELDGLVLLDATDDAGGAAVATAGARSWMQGGDTGADLTMLDTDAFLTTDGDADTATDDATDAATDDAPGGASGGDALLDLPLLDDAAAVDSASSTLDFLAVDEPVAAARNRAADDAPATAPPRAADEGLDLGDWLRASEPAPTTRMTARAPQQSDNEDAAFAEALRAFKAGVARSVPEADYDSHYDLGIAYKEMGLLDEAIGALQKAARAPGRPLRPLEALGQCFLDRGEPALAVAALDGVARELETGRGADDASAVGVCYLLASAFERLGRMADARRWYVRVLALDYSFRDAAPRLASLPAPD